MNGWQLLRWGGYTAGVSAAVVIVVAFAVMGFSLMIVLSGSMEPVMMPGDVVVVAPVDPDAIAPGDIVSFWRHTSEKDIIVTHRVIGIDGDSGTFATKGDNNNVADSVMLEKSDIIGRTVFLIPYLGYTTEMRAEIILFCLVLPSLFLIIGEVRNSASGPLTAYKQARRDRRAMRAVYSIRYRRLGLILLLCSLPFWILSLPSLIGMIGAGDGAIYSPDATVDIQGAGWLPEVYVMEPLDETGVPRYGLVTPGDTVSFTADEMASSGAFARAPHMIPVFWVILLADMHPFLPALVIAIIPGFVITLLLLPLWRRCSMIKKPVRRRIRVAF
jgi:signal peptidase